MARAGYYESQIINEITNLDLKLIEYIKQQLYFFGFLTDEGYITPRGIAELCEENYFYEDSSTGYIFQDPFSLTLLNQFSKNLEFADVEVDNNNKPKIILAEGNPKNAYWITFNDVLKYVKPSPIDVLNAITTFSLMKKTNIEEVSEADGITYNDQIVSRVSFISDEPELLYLVIQTLPGYTNEEEWEIINPFDLDFVDPKIKSFVKQRLKSDNNLEKYLIERYERRQPENNDVKASIDAESKFKRMLKMSYPKFMEMT